MTRCIILLVLLLAPIPAVAETRVALVIGVSDYESPDLQPLPNAVSDAKAIGEKLQALGFDADTVLNPTRADLRRALSKLFRRRQATQADTALIYFAGHGLQAEGKGFL